MDMRGKCLLRFTSSSVHMAMMRCPFNNDTAQLTANRLWNSLIRNPCCCDSDASKQLSLVDHSLDPVYFTNNNNNNNNPLTLSELNSLGFDRSWTIDGLNFTSGCASEMITLKTMCNTLVKNDSQHMLTNFRINLLKYFYFHDEASCDVGLSVDEILNIGRKAFCNVEALTIGTILFQAI
jgi:hypothetical protein